MSDSWIDKQIREARERGDFDDLPGHGKPIADLDRPRDEMWWVKAWIAREKVGVTPPTLGLRKDVEVAMEGLGRLRNEGEVRRMVSDLNERIRRVNRMAASGPPTTMMPFDVDEVVERWRRLSLS